MRRKKILKDDNIRITATTVRVPVKYSHSISTNIEFENPFELEDIKKRITGFQWSNIKG